MQIKPGPDLLLEVRVGLMRKGTTLGAWCRRNGVLRANARLALLGGWNGQKGTALRDQLIAAAGLKVAA